MLRKKWMTINVLASALVLVFLGAVNAAVQKGPYLIYDGVNTGMTVLWQLNSSQSCTIDWGEDIHYSPGRAITGENGSDTHEHQHKYTITGLIPNTQYFYLVSCELDNVGSGSFYTAPLDGTDSVKFLVYGDTRSYPADHNSVSAQMINTYTSLSDPGYQTITLHVGDWVNDGDLEADWAYEFFDPSYSFTNEFQANMPLNGCVGNHEGSGNLFYKYFPYRYKPGGFYWSFDYGPAHIAVIDQYIDYSPGSTQYLWLENDLASSTKKWKFLVFHEPGWSAGGHRNNTDVQNYIQPLAVEYGVDIIFTGHNHYYARAPVAGIQHITTGGGGAPLTSPNPNYENVVASAESYHFCEVKIQGDDLHFTARDESGEVLDEFHMNQLVSNSVANSDILVKGTVSGSYTDTHELDSTMETITEQSSGGKPSNRYSYLEHKWAFQVKRGAVMTLFAEVTASASSDGDAFVFAWSTDDVNYTTMFIVDDTSTSAQSYSLDPTTSGKVYVRLVDTDRSAGTGNSLDSISVDQILIRTETEQGDPPAAPSNLTATAISTSEIFLEWTDNASDEDSFRVQRFDASEWVGIATLGANVHAYTDSGLQSGSHYSYRVIAFNEAGSSDPSNTVSATTEGSLIVLTANAYKLKGVRMVDLSWSGAAGLNVNIYRDDLELGYTLNDGFHTDIIGKKGESSYLYKVCEEGTTNCSNEATASF